MVSLKPGRGKAPVAGGEIAYLVAGQGPPIAGTHPYWMPKAGYLPLPGFTTITVWPRGFGASSPARDDRDYGFWRLADDLDAVRRHLGLARWVYWGVSFGGMTGQVYGLHYPDTLTALILDGTAASHHFRDDPASIWPQVQAKAATNPDVAAFLAIPSLRTLRVVVGLWADLLVSEGGSGEPPDKEWNPHALAACLRRLPEFDVRARLPELHIPTLVVVGEHDRSCPPSQARVIAEGIPGARLRVFPGTGHGVRFHNPPGLLELVRQFVEAA